MYAISIIYYNKRRETKKIIQNPIHIPKYRDQLCTAFSVKLVKQKPTS